jgi:hypothetical protein
MLGCRAAAVDGAAIKQPMPAAISHKGLAYSSQLFMVMTFDIEFFIANYSLLLTIRHF